MKALTTLIKLRKNELDEKRRVVAILNKQKELLEENVSKLKEELIKEQNLAATNSDITTFYFNYAEGNKNRQQQILLEINHVDTLLDCAKEELFTMFSELKRLEIALENKKKLAAIEQEKKEEELLNEMTLNQFLQKNNND